MKPPVGWRRLVEGGLACVAAVLAVLFLIHQIREALPPPEEAHAPQKPVDHPPEGPPMRIDPGELARAGRERDDNGLGMTLCWCPPGSFHMGRLDPGGIVERSQRDLYRREGVGVTLRRGFWMGKYEVTQAQWRRVMGATLREQRARDPTQPRPVGDDTMREHVGEGPDYPIYFTNHSEAEEFCRKLSEAERAADRLEPGWEYRLPTEAQWEFACRAGTTTFTAFGDRLSGTQANFDGSLPFNGAPAGPYLHETTPVGSYPPNAWGLHDMHGNVWEWCRDGFTRLGAGTDPPERVIRGGCWHNPGSMCLSTTRGPGEVRQRGSGLGFRAALVPPGF
jgi:formylglycine-generating enzyme required for sulfatase activity